ncbi:MAG: TIGR03915 family putative DNA repair protein [Faecalibacterium sp.]
MQAQCFPSADVIYQYDGTFEGFLSCVFVSFARKETPFAIWDDAQVETSLYPVCSIATDPAHAARVFGGVANKISPHAQQLITTCFLSGSDEKELLLLRFLQLGFAIGSRALSMLGDVHVAPIMAMQKNVLHEAHQYKGFLRFEEHQGMLGAIIAPKNAILPLLRGHFCARFPEENFLIYDETHCSALLYQDHRVELLDLCAPLQLPSPDEKESQYQQLWKQFYDTIAIKERRNEVCRRNLCPKRYWAHMSELRDEL